MKKARPTTTHYVYLSGPENMREPTGLMDLSRHSVHQRRGIIHRLLAQGELVASVPFGVEVRNMKDLRAALKWIASGRKPQAGP